ncbi:MAG: toll/interleukin-1 receptor domain-containing protein [Cyanobacteria bacterium P01_F01_bin.13]
MTKPIEIFFSYSHKDESFREQLEIHLSMLKRQNLIKPWHDRMITAGDEWKGEIDKNLNSADIILLLVTANFLASDYCYDIEMKRSLERHEIGEACVIPIILTPVEGWAYSPFSKLQVLPRDGKPVTRWDDADEAFVNVARGIRKSINLLSTTSDELTSNEYSNFLEKVPDNQTVSTLETLEEVVPDDWFSQKSSRVSRFFQSLFDDK